jgi:hypothetical protein
MQKGPPKFNPEKMEVSKVRSSGELSFAFPSQQRLILIFVVPDENFELFQSMNGPFRLATKISRSRATWRRAMGGTMMLVLDSFGGVE